MLLARRLRELYLMCMRAESRLGRPLTEVLLEVRRWGYRVLLEVSTEDIDVTACEICPTQKLARHIYVAHTCISIELSILSVSIRIAGRRKCCAVMNGVSMLSVQRQWRNSLH